MGRFDKTPYQDNAQDFFFKNVLSRFNGIIDDRNRQFTRNDSKMFFLMGFLIDIFIPEMVEYDEIEPGQRFACFNTIADDLCRPHTYLVDNSIYLYRRGDGISPEPVFRMQP